MKRPPTPASAALPAPALAPEAQARPSSSPSARSRAAAGRAALLRPVAAVACEVSPDGEGGEFATARRRILRWVEAHAGPLPSSFRTADPRSFGGETLRHETDAVRLAATSRARGRGRYFGLTVEADRAPGCPGRRIVAALYRSASGTGLRTVVELPKRSGAGRGPSAGAPGAVHDLARSPGLMDYGWRIGTTPWIVEDEPGVEGLIHLIGDPDRTRPVFATGLSGGETDPEACAVDSWDLAHRTAGLAHVVVLTGPMTYLLSDRVGRRFSVFGGALRTYRPGCRIGEEARDHPIALPETVRQWPCGGPRQFTSYLTREAARLSLAYQLARSGWAPEHLMPEAHDEEAIHPLGAGEDTSPTPAAFAPPPQLVEAPRRRAG